MKHTNVVILLCSIVLCGLLTSSVSAMHSGGRRKRGKSIQKQTQENTSPVRVEHGDDGNGLNAGAGTVGEVAVAAIPTAPTTIQLPMQDNAPVDSVVAKIDLLDKTVKENLGLDQIALSQEKNDNSSLSASAIISRSQPEESAGVVQLQTGSGIEGAADPVVTANVTIHDDIKLLKDELASLKEEQKNAMSNTSTKQDLFAEQLKTQGETIESLAQKKELISISEELKRLNELFEEQKNNISTKPSRTEIVFLSEDLGKLKSVVEELQKTTGSLVNKKELDAINNDIVKLFTNLQEHNKKLIELPEEIAKKRDAEQFKGWLSTIWHSRACATVYYAVGATVAISCFYVIWTAATVHCSTMAAAGTLDLAYTYVLCPTVNFANAKIALGLTALGGSATALVESARKFYTSLKITNV